MTDAAAKNRALVEALVASGISNREAAWAVDRVLGAVPEVLTAGRSVRIIGACTLTSSAKPERLKGPGQGHLARRVRKVKVRDLAVLEQGDPVDVGPPEKCSLSFRALGGLA